METIFGSNVTVEELAKRIGLPLSIVIGLLAIAVIWWNWDEVKKRPGVARTLAYLRGKLFPAPEMPFR